jgi:hypothetical protein
VRRAAGPSRAYVLFTLLALAAAPVAALETDQYSTWGKPLAAATAVLNAKMDLEIERAVRAAARYHSGGPPPCRAIARQLHRRLSFEIFQPIEVWASQSPLVPRLPASSGEELAFRREDLNGNHGPLDFGRWVPDSPTVEVNGVRFGTDKLSHFISSGWRYDEVFRKARRRGRSDAQALAAALRWGIFEEFTTNGLLTDGVFSPADLEANYEGMRFYQDLCSGPDPLLHLVDGEWRWRRRFDWRDVVTPGWDESFDVSIYSASRWRKVRPRLLDYCSRRDDPAVIARLSRYRRLARSTPTQQAVARLVREGKLPDPGRFTLAANCPALPLASTETEGEPPASPAAPPGTTEAAAEEETALETEIAVREAERQRRVFLLAAARATWPLRLAASLGWFVTGVESDFDCHTICDLRGATFQVEPGLAGVQLAAGYARIFGETGHSGRFLVHPYLGLGLRGVVSRTWSHSSLGPSGMTFAGVEGEFAITRVSFTVGVLRHVSGRDPERKWALSWGLGWGF